MEITQTVIIFDIDPEVSHIPIWAPEGPAETLDLIAGTERPIHMYCGAGFLVGQLTEIGTVAMVSKPVCLECQVGDILRGDN
jgi:hypothetical protein